MFVIIEYIGKIRDQLNKKSPNREQIFKLLKDAEDTTWDTIRRMKSQVERCQYPEKDTCEICPILLGRGGKER
jgi:hypothetical protein